MEIAINTIDGNIYAYEEEDAENIEHAINRAAVRGAEWTVPTELSDGWERVFVLANIVSISIKKAAQPRD